MTWLSRFLTTFFSLWHYGGCQRPFPFRSLFELSAFYFYLFQFEKALKYAETHHRRLRRHSIYLIGRKYLDHLIENGKFEEIGPLYQRIFKNEKRLWEEEITRLILLHKVDAISTFVPMGHEKNQLKLEPHIYEAILISLLKSQLISEWKCLIILPTAGGVLADFWVPNEIDYWNYQHMLLFWFREASQNLSLFRQLFFS